MSKKQAAVTDMLPEILEILETFGYEKHTLWGTMYGDFTGLVNYYRQHGIACYDPEVTAGYVRTVEEKYRNGSFSRSHCSNLKRAARRFDEFYSTGTLSWKCNRRESKFKLNAEYQALLDEYLLSREFHPNTKWDFAWAVRKYLFYYQEHGILSLKDASTGDARNFVADTAVSVSAGSLHNILCYLRQFHAFLAENNVDAPDCIPLFSYHVPRKTSVKGFVTDDELSAVLAQIDVSTHEGKRDMAIISLGATTGLRAVDIISLKLTDIDWVHGEIRITQSKTGGLLRLPILPETGEAVKDYILNGRPQSSSAEVFLREKAPFIAMSSGVAIGYMFEQYSKKAGIERRPFDGKGFHGLRRRLARNMLVSGTPVTTIAQVLGHQGMESAKQYLSLDSENLKECALGFSGVPLERRMP